MLIKYCESKIDVAKQRSAEPIMHYELCIMNY